MKQLNLLCLFITSLLLLACDKDEPLPSLADEEMVIGHWERDYFRWEIYDKNGVLTHEGGPFTTEFTMKYTDDEYTLSSLGLVETGIYTYKVNQGQRYLQLEEVNNVISRTFYIDSLSRSNLDIYYRIDKYIYGTGEPIYDGYTMYYEFYKKRR